eukprot:TRINITY_DN26405_c0_g1_i1.p1 TRINITY_DN26405_c0_g1~~TRINITY_DN26405_c0_g1_i1.p1  ORF type:complete len:925 (-),score=131.48 TRINITY_DN26405_c0_g1_i1:136-2910(-)
MGCGASEASSAYKTSSASSSDNTPQSSGSKTSGRSKQSRPPKPKAKPRLSRITPESTRWLDMLRETFGQDAFYVPTERRGISLEQLETVLKLMRNNMAELYDTAPRNLSKTGMQPLHVDSYNLYHVSEWVIKPATMSVPCNGATSCSFVELVAREEQMPVWFISHWWGEPVESFFACVRHHSYVRKIENCFYWVCAYANRQHELGSEVTHDPRESSFYRAMQLSRGVVLILNPKLQNDPPAVALQRIWVQFEEAMSWKIADERDGDFLYDIVTSDSRQDGCFEGSWRTATAFPVMLADGLTNKDMEGNSRPFVSKRRREAGFPIEIMEAALNAEILKAQASREDDRTHILNALTRCPLDRKPLKQAEAYDMTDRRLHALIAAAVWPAVMDGSVSISETTLSNALAQDEWRRRLVLDFSNCARLSNLEGLASGLAGPKEDSHEDIAGLQSLEYLKLSFDACNNLKALSPLHRVFELFRNLKTLYLSAAPAKSLEVFEDNLLEGLQKLVAFQKLSLFFSYAPCKIRLQTFLSSMRGLKVLTISMVHCDVEDFRALSIALVKNTNLESATLELSHNKGITDLTSRLHDLPALKHLELRFEGCVNIAKFGVCSGFNTAMPLESFILRMAYCTTLTHPRLLAIDKLQRLKLLQRFQLDLSGCSNLQGIDELKSVLSNMPWLQSLEVSLSSGRKFHSAMSLKDNDQSTGVMTAHLPLAIKTFSNSSTAFMSDQKPADDLGSPMSTRSAGARRGGASPVPARSASLRPSTNRRQTAVESDSSMPRQLSEDASPLPPRPASSPSASPHAPKAANQGSDGSHLRGRQRGINGFSLAPPPGPRRRVSSVPERKEQALAANNGDLLIDRSRRTASSSPAPKRFNSSLADSDPLSPASARGRRRRRSPAKPLDGAFIPHHRSSPSLQIPSRRHSCA